jgi:hypothetical protein
MLVPVQLTGDPAMTMFLSAYELTGIDIEPPDPKLPQFSTADEVVGLSHSSMI